MEVNQGASTSKDVEQTSLFKEDDILPGCSNFDDYLQTAYPFITKGVKCSNSLPCDQEFSYYSTFPKFVESMKTQEVDVLNILHKLLLYCGGKRSISSQSSDEKFELITDMNDLLLDKVAKNLIEMEGTNRNPIILGNDFGEYSTVNKNISGSWNKNHLTNTNKRFINNNHINSSIITRRDEHFQNRIHKPQLLFEEEIDNKNETWIPKIKDKPNALKPLSILLTRDENNIEHYTHPYDYELTLFKVDKKRLCSVDQPKMPTSIHETMPIFIEVESQVDELIVDLLKQKEIAVDLEHHSYRSFMGITCLLQISTRDKDYLIDALSLRHVLYKLNEVFTKSSILKIFHSADCDIEWLQRDLSVYVVNMFDTYQAAKVLNYPKLGLSYLLKKFCNIECEKKYQLFDWRIRPIPEKAKNYARTDTHYLIYIYEMMTNEIISISAGQTNLLQVVYQRSTETCRKIYHKPILTEDSYMTLYRKSKRLFDSRQLYALKEIYKWRDSVAREEDESPGYVLSNHMMMQICQTLPREMQGILACCNPVPPAVKQNLLTLHNIVLKAKEQPLIMPLVEESAKPSNQFSASRDFDIEAKISTYIHDNAGLEFRDDYPTLLGQQEDVNDDGDDDSCGVGLKVNNKSIEMFDLNDMQSTNLLSDEPKLMVMVNTVDEFIDLEDNNGNDNDKSNVDDLSSILEKVKFVTPYERYKKVLPYSRKLEEEEREKARIQEEKFQQKLLQAQYNISPNTETKEDTEEFQEKENLLKRPIIKADSNLTNENPGKRRKMEKSGKVKTKELPQTAAIKKESNEVATKKEDNDVATNDEGDSIGVCGGEVSVDGKPNKPRAGASRHQRQHQHFTPYDYRKVDFSKFHSDNRSFKANNNPDTKFKGKVRRNNKFEGRHHYSNRKGAR